MRARQSTWGISPYETVLKTPCLDNKAICGLTSRLSLLRSLCNQGRCGASASCVFVYITSRENGVNEYLVSDNSEENPQPTYSDFTFVASVDKTSGRPVGSV